MHVEQYTTVDKYVCIGTYRTFQPEVLCQAVNKDLRVAISLYQQLCIVQQVKFQYQYQCNYELLQHLVHACFFVLGIFEHKLQRVGGPGTTGVQDAVSTCNLCKGSQGFSGVNTQVALGCCIPHSDGTQADSEPVKLALVVFCITNYCIYWWS